MKPIQKPFTYKLQMIKVVAKGLQKANFYAILSVLVMLLGIFNLSPAISSLMNDVIIRSTGRIATIAPTAYKSEIRGVFIHESIFAYSHDWNVIAQTLKQYKINAVYANFIGHAGGIRSHDEWIAAIEAFHSRGIEFHVAMNVLGDMASTPETAAIGSGGNPVSWNCPIKVRDLVKQTVEHVASTYDIDGFMFDYIRYDTTSMCYCNECKAAFEAWLGETIVDWPGDFAPDQPRWKEFAEWRNIPVTELVRDIHTWMLTIKPNLKFSLASWTYFQDCPIYWRKWIGQDTGDWIRNGYLDTVAPMMYTTDLTELQDEIQTNFKYMTAGPEGKIPLLAFLRNDITTPAGLKNLIDLVRSLGCDGWIIWRYGGPGIDGAPVDITPYLSILDIPDVFSLRNIQVSPSDTQATVTWITELPATSKVEYSMSPLFNASWELWRGDFNYWDIDHVAGAIAEDNTTVTDHSITLTGLSPETKYYLRVQSEGSGGIATSKVLTFTTSEGT